MKQRQGQKHGARRADGGRVRQEAEEQHGWRSEAMEGQHRESDEAWRIESMRCGGAARRPKD